MTRFWNKVEKSSQCWQWTGGKTWDGYGRIKLNGKTVMAHRVAYAMLKGEVPKHLILCHTCDNPSCVNPDHLFLGTHKDNALDREAKGRSKRAGKPKLAVCARGHERSPNNLYDYGKGGACKKCLAYTKKLRRAKLSIDPDKP